MPPSPKDARQPKQDIFGPPTTLASWARIQVARNRTNDPACREAWEGLVKRYEGPISICLRATLRSHPQADDAVRDFFTKLYIDPRILDKVRPENGRFRAYLQAVARRFALEWLKQQKVRGGADLTDVDLDIAIDAPSPEELGEESAWASQVLSRALDALVRMNPRDGQLFAQAYGVHGFPEVGRSALALQAGLTTNALNVAIHRMREELEGLLRAELRDISGSDADFDEECSILIARMMQAHPGLLQHA